MRELRWTAIGAIVAAVLVSCRPDSVRQVHLIGEDHSSGWAAERAITVLTDTRPAFDCLFLELDRRYASSLAACQIDGAAYPECAWLSDDPVMAAYLLRVVPKRLMEVATRVGVRLVPIDAEVPTTARGREDLYGRAAARDPELLRALLHDRDVRFGHRIVAETLCTRAVFKVGAGHLRGVATRLRERGIAVKYELPPGR